MPKQTIPNHNPGPHKAEKKVPQKPESPSFAHSSRVTYIDKTIMEYNIFNLKEVGLSTDLVNSLMFPNHLNKSMFSYSQQEMKLENQTDRLPHIGKITAIPLQKQKAVAFLWTPPKFSQTV